MPAEVDVSIILLLENEEHDFVDCMLNLHQQLLSFGFTHELILAVNGSSGFARKCLESWSVDAPDIHLIELNKKVSSGVCLHMVIPECQGEVLLVCGPYQQIKYSDLKQMLAEVFVGQVDLALPWRQNRVDPLVNRWQSWLFNWLVRKLIGTPFHDLSSTLRVVRKSILEEINLYGDLYRYLPVLAQRRGFNVREHRVEHLEEFGKIGFFGVREYVSRFVDLFSMHFTLGFSRKPLRYFGFRGLVVFFLGLMCICSAFVLRLFEKFLLGDSPLLMAGLLLMVSGSWIWGIGLLGEIISFVFGRMRKDYIVETILK
jgi:hypothetical protein